MPSAAAAAAAAIFVLDLYTPLDLAIGILYLIPLALISMQLGHRTLFTVAGLCSGLIVLGFVLSPPGLPLLYAAFNRTLDIALLWLAAWFLAARRTGLLQAIASIHDSTAHKQAEAHRQALLDAAPDATVTIDRTGRIAHVNRQMEQVFGYRPDELLGQPIEILIPARFHQNHQAHRDGFMAAPRLRAMGEGQALFARRKDGTELPVEISLSPIDTAEGQQVIASIRDITDRMQTEQALRQSEEQLRQSQKMEAVGTLAGGIAHDFNNLLTVMLGYNALALTHLPPEHPLYRSLDEIRKAGERATSLTSQLLAFSRQQVLSPVVLDLNQLITTMGQLLRRLIGEQIELEIHPQVAAPLIKADRGQIEHILVNLAVNARDAMPTGGQLRIDTTNVDVDEAEAARHAGLRPGPYVRLTIRDTGHGMDQATQARVFEPFFTTKPPGKGTGLGLAMVYGSVRQSGGAIWMDSHPQGGTTFTLCFPTTRTPLTVAPPATPLRSGQETILLVEDEPAVRALVTTILSAQGYHMLDAPSGTEALRLIATLDRPIHLLLTDIIMPGMNGRQLAARLTAHDPTLRTLLISGYHDDAIAPTDGTETELPLLRKPFTPAALTQRVREVLDAPPSPPTDPSTPP